MSEDDDPTSDDAPGRDSESGDDATGRDSESGDDAPGTVTDDGSGGPGRDPDVDAEDSEAAFAANPERAAILREVAEDVRGESSESEQLANVLYRTSDIYDPDEDTTPEEVVQNVKFILEVKERGGLGR